MRDPIKDMYKTVFDDYTVNKDGGEWEAMESRIQKQNFLHFRWAQFNIYYAVSIIITLFLSSAMAGHYFYFNYVKKGIAGKGDIVQYVQEDKTIVISGATTKTSPDKRAEVKLSEVTSVSTDQKQNKPSASSFSQTQHEESIIKPENKISEQDLNVSENIPAESAKDPFIKVQKVVIVKQDTIHKVDTIKTKGRFWKRH